MPYKLVILDKKQTENGKKCGKKLLFAA